MRSTNVNISFFHGGQIYSLNCQFTANKSRLTVNRSLQKSDEFDAGE